MGHLVKALVEHIETKIGVTHVEAARLVDGDYARGYVMYLVAAHESTCDTSKIVTKHKKSHMRIFDSKDGMKFWTTDIARDIVPHQRFSVGRHTDPSQRDGAGSNLALASTCRNGQEWA